MALAVVDKQSSDHFRLYSFCNNMKIDYRFNSQIERKISDGTEKDTKERKSKGKKEAARSSHYKLNGTERADGRTEVTDPALLLRRSDRSDTSDSSPCTV